MRIVFLGTPEEAVGPLRALHDAGHEIALVITQPDKRRGRGKTMTPSPVKAAANELGLAVSHRMKDLLTVEVDLGVVVAFGRLIKPEMLDRITFLNLHPSLLPRWRGATPVESAILAGDRSTGICVMKLEEEMDAGPIYASATVDVDDNETAQHLSDRLFAIGTEMLLQQLDQGLSEPVEQVGEPVFAKKLTPEDFHIDWSASATQANRQSRIGRAWTTFRDRRFLVLESRVSEELIDGAPGTISGTRVATGQGALELLTVQPEGKGPQRAVDWANGARLTPEDHFA